MEVCYVLLVGFLKVIFDSNLPREITTILKYYDYFLIPLVQIYSSAPIKRFMASMNHAQKWIFVYYVNQYFDQA